MAVTAQASTSQVAGRSLTLQLKADDEVDEAQVSLRRSGAAGPETVLWQGRLEKTMTNSLDVRLEPHAATQQLMIRGRQLDTQSYYVFAPAAAKGVTGMAAAVGRPGTATKLPALKESKPSGAVWADVFQGIASEKGVYVLAPAAFPMQVPSGLGAQPAARDVDRALREIGYEQRPLPGAITIEAAPEALPKAARGRSRP